MVTGDKIVLAQKPRQADNLRKYKIKQIPKMDVEKKHRFRRFLVFFSS